MKAWLKLGVMGAGMGLIVSLLIFFLDSSFYNMLDLGRTLYNTFFGSASLSLELSDVIFSKIIFVLFLFPILLGFILGGVVGKFKSSSNPQPSKIKKVKKKR